MAEALEAKLKRERLREAIRSTAGILSAEDYPYWANLGGRRRVGPGMAGREDGTEDTRRPRRWSAMR